MSGGFNRKIVLTEKQQAYLVKHFKNTKNDVLMERLGLTHSTLHRMARELGLKKTPQFRRKTQREAVAKARETNRANNWPPKGYRIPRSEEFFFRPGERAVDRIGKEREKERIRKAADARRKTFRLEKARAAFGLPRTTRMEVIRRPRHYVLQRNYLRRRGYIIDRGGMTAYYTPETRRSAYYETRTRETCKKYVPFKFKPLEDRT